MIAPYWEIAFKVLLTASVTWPLVFCTANVLWDSCTGWKYRLGFWLLAYSVVVPLVWVALGIFMILRGIWA